MLLGDPLVKALLQLTQLAHAQTIVQDTIAMLTFHSGRICFACISFVQQNALCFAPFYHRSKPWALATIGRCGMDFIQEPLLIAPSKTLVA